MVTKHNGMRAWSESDSRAESAAATTGWSSRRSPFASGPAEGEPSLGELLSDPIAHAMMRADGVVAEDIIAIFERLSARMAQGLSDDGRHQG